jgi:hypothetical protein
MIGGDSLLDRPRVVLTIPRSRGGLVRRFDAMRAAATGLSPLWMRDAQRRQRRSRARIESGQAPEARVRGRACSGA